MTTIVGLFHYADNAQELIDLLTAGGYQPEQIGVIVPQHARTSRGEPAYRPDAAGAAAGVGGATGSAVMSGLDRLMFGLEGLLITGIGPAMGSPMIAVPLAPALSEREHGKRNVALHEVLANRGVPPKDAEVYAEGVKRGGVLVAVDTDEPARVRSMMLEQNAADVDALRKRWEHEGWQRFDVETPAGPHYPAF